jgi:hypothetical protein
MQRRVTEGGRAAGCADPDPGPARTQKWPTAVWEKAAAMTEARRFTGSIAAVFPTYNDEGNMRSITARLRSALPGADKGIRRGHAATGIHNGGLE